MYKQNIKMPPTGVQCIIILLHLFLLLFILIITMDVDRITALGIFMVSNVSSSFVSDEPIPEDCTMHVLHQCQFVLQNFTV